jgi:hypothetical protein
MKPELSNKKVAALEIANQVMYSLKVLAIGLFIPFSFVFGITYKRHDNVAAKSVNISKDNSVTQNSNTIQLVTVGTGKNS